MKTEKLSILSILLCALCIGLVAGAGAGNDHILPVTVVTAIVLIMARDKIAKRSDTTKRELSNNSLESDGRIGEYYTWPELNQFQYIVKSNSYQGTINQLLQLQENVSNHLVGYSDRPVILKAHLIPDNDHLYDKNAVRIDIHDRTVGYLNPEEAIIYRGCLNAKGISNQITVCNALIEKINDKVDNSLLIYRVKLDIQPFFDSKDK